MKRICIYQLYDKEGIVDDYVFYWIDELKKIAFDTFVVSNGHLTEDSKKRLDSTCTQVLIREDQGYDAMAFRYVLFEKLGREYVNEYDECLIINDSVFGPFYSLEKVFDEMSEKKCDFWGITSQYPIKNYLEEGNDIPYHIQAYFVVFKKAALESDIFWDFWKELSNINKYEDAVIKYEFALTQKLIGAGLISDVYCKEEYSEDGYVDLMERPIILLEKGVPVLKKKVVLDSRFLDLNCFASKIYLYSMLLYIRTHDKYDCDLIEKCIERELGVKYSYYSFEKYKNKKIIGMRNDRCWNYNAISEKLYKFLTKHQRVWIYGAGHNARLIIRIILELKLAGINGVMVSDLQNNPSDLYGISVYAASEIVKTKQVRVHGVIIAIKSAKEAYHIKEYLGDNEIKNIVTI